MIQHTRVAMLFSNTFAHDDIDSTGKHSVTAFNVNQLKSPCLGINWLIGINQADYDHVLIRQFIDQLRILWLRENNRIDIDNYLSKSIQLRDRRPPQVMIIVG